VVARRELGHHAAEVLVQLDLGVDDVGEDVPAALDERDRSFVAAGLDSEREADY
jgi:hypothetical protein